MMIIPLLFVLIAAAYAQIDDPPCDGTSVVVNSRTSQTDYTISMSAESSSNTKCDFDVNELPKMLKGSGESWRNTCKRARNNVLVIEPALDCDESTKVWKAQYLTFQIKSANRVQVHVDDTLVFSEEVENQFTYDNAIRMTGKSIKVSALPRSRFSVIELSEVQVNFCCEEVSGREETRVEIAGEPVEDGAGDKVKIDKDKGKDKEDIVADMAEKLLGDKKSEKGDEETEVGLEADKDVDEEDSQDKVIEDVERR